MEAAQSLYELGGVEAGTPLTKLLVLAQMVEQLTAIEKVHHEVELSRCLERVLKLHDEGTVDLFQNVSLG